MAGHEARLAAREAPADLAPTPDGDAPWISLFRAGAVAAALAVVSYVAALIIVGVTSPPPTSGGAAMLEFVGAHRTVYIVRQLLWMTPSLFLMVVFLALAVALRARSRSLAAVAGLIAVSSWVLTFAWPATGDGSLAMVVLSDKYAEAGTLGQRAPFAAGAEVLIALNDVPAVIGVLQTLGILLIALLMLRGPFGAGAAWLGIATGAVGMLSEALRPLLGWAYAGYGLLLFVWLGWIAVALWRHGRRG
ncbi:hypothetical protein Ade02nite_71650 [Paractinoplanes deccanensis]|uniref:DUF4386 family protein n=1 Tax=Paractinoplanes deccanensis TaxID=113561 RepID=A0ABQ3YEV0_9ACTN|nr:hypothetical protein [Actinoplanes deccanensis]GID78524.1 hypothetical protein Ade02nite_71650 [Actinoplanes deccanensis]